MKGLTINCNMTACIKEAVWDEAYTFRMSKQNKCRNSTEQWNNSVTENQREILDGDSERLFRKWVRNKKKIALETERSTPFIWK